VGVWERMRAVSETGFFNDRRRNGESNGWAVENRLTRTILDSSDISPTLPDERLAVKGSAQLLSPVGETAGTFTEPYL